MPGKNCADIVFCIDSSGSMQPAIDAVRANISSLLEGLTTGGGQSYSWDVRFDFLAFNDNRSLVHCHNNLRAGGMTLLNAIYTQPDPSLFFTQSVDEFRKALAKVTVEDEEEQLLALDVAMDYPWRPSNACHRVVVLLTDEAVETGLEVEKQKKLIPALIKKIIDKRIKLFIIAPDSEAFYELAKADRCEYDGLDTDNVNGLRNVDFSKMLSTIGKSVSVSQTYDGGQTAPQPLFGQEKWTAFHGTLNVSTDR